MKLGDVVYDVGYGQVVKDGGSFSDVVVRFKTR